MTPRKASLRVAHQRSCPNASATSIDSLKGCRCVPSFYTFQRGPDGKVKKGPRVKDRKVAQIAVNKIQVDIDEGRVGQRRLSQVTLREWADQFEEITEDRVRAGQLKPRTLQAYRETLALACKAIGDVPLREIGPADLRAFQKLFETTSPASQLRHLRQLSVALTAAVDEGHLDVNPVRAFTKKQRLRAPRKGKAPFDDNELQRLWAAYRAFEPVYLASAQFAVESGARLGEIIALDWPNVDLTNGRVRVDHSWDPEAGLVTPKSGEARVIYLTPEALAVLEGWVAVAGATDEGPVFPNPYGGRLERRMVQRRLELAMKAAGVPRLHPEIRLPRSFHSFRYTTSVVMQRRGVHPRLIEQTLGHGSLELTYGVYGGWTPAQLQEEAVRER